MLIKNVCKGLVKKPVVTLICVLLLTAAMLLFQLAAAMTGVVTAPRVEKHLTIAVPIESIQRNQLPDIKENIRRQVTSVTECDTRICAQGYSAGLEPYVPTAQGGMASTVELGLFTVKCTEVSAEQEGRLFYRYRISFEIEQPIAVHDAFAEYTSVGTLFQVSLHSSREYEGMFEEGKTYLIWLQMTHISEDGKCTFYLSTGTQLQKIVEDNGKHVLFEPFAGSGRFFPKWSELNVPYEEFLKTDVGQLWQELILPKMEICYHSVVVIGTDQVESIPAFNQDLTKIVLGETITADQYENGEQVCLISEELAELNGLTVGDTIPLGLYPATYRYVSSYSLSYYNTFDTQTGFVDEGEYRIVGIYRNTEPYEKVTDHGTHPNTVYIPKRALKGSYTIADAAYDDPHQISYIMKAGQERAFEAEIALLGYGGMFDYYSGPVVDDTVTKLALADAQTRLVEDSAYTARRLNTVGAILVAVATFLMMWASKQEIGRFYAIETSNTLLFWHIFLREVPTIAIAVGASHLIARQTLGEAVPQVLGRIADPEFAERLIETLAEIPSLQHTVWGGAALILIFAVIFAAIGSKRCYHFEYREKE